MNSALKRNTEVSYFSFPRVQKLQTEHTHRFQEVHQQIRNLQIFLVKNICSHIPYILVEGYRNTHGSNIEQITQ